MTHETEKMYNVHCTYLIANHFHCSQVGPYLRPQAILGTCTLVNRDSIYIFVFCIRNSLYFFRYRGSEPGKNRLVQLGRNHLGDRIYTVPTSKSSKGWFTCWFPLSHVLKSKFHILVLNVIFWPIG